MTSNNSFKKLVRQRMRLTGEKYTTALKHLRVKPSPTNIPHLPDILPDASSLTLIEKTLQQDGLILISGPTGSGKTTFMASVLQYAATDLKLHTALFEKFPESEFSEKGKVIHIADNPTHSTSTMLQYIARMRLSVFGYGEIRHCEENLLYAAHVRAVVSTMHALESVSSVPDRLFNLYETEKMGAKALQKLKLIVQVEAVPMESDNQITRGVVAAVLPFNEEAFKAWERTELDKFYADNGYETLAVKKQRLFNELAD